MRIFLLVTVIVLLLSCSEGWFGSRDRSSNGGGSNGGESKGFFGRIGSGISKGFKSAVDGVKKAGSFVSGAAKGTASMGKAYKDMRDANWKNSDKYFHARGNYDAAKHGAGGKWAAKTISDAREWVDRNIKGDSAASSAADQRANEWGRSGKNPNKFRPKGLPGKYRK